jgi:hypothetical protein
MPANRRWGPMHKCGIKECPNQTVNVICPQCTAYFKAAGRRPHTWRLAEEYRATGRRRP